MNWEGITALVAAVGVIINMYLQYNQHAKDVRTDYELERMKANDAARRKKDRESSQRIFGEIWNLLYNLQADRVYVMQPHPLTHNLFVSVVYEARAGGVTTICDVFNRLPVGDVAGLVSELRAREFIYWPTLDAVKDDRARALLHNAGTSVMAIKRLSDSSEWIGSLIVDFAQPRDVEIAYLKSAMNGTANCIQYILPEIK